MKVVMVGMVVLTFLFFGWRSNQSNPAPAVQVASVVPSQGSQTTEKVKIEGHHLDEAMIILKGEGPESAVKYAEDLGHTAYNLGLFFQRLGRNEDSLEWFNTLTRDLNDPNYFYGRAWILWTLLHTEKAYSDATYIITSDNAPNLTKARAYYLLGLIDHFNGEYNFGLENANKCSILYESLGKSAGLYLANYLKARLTILAAEDPQNLSRQTDLINEAHHYIEIAISNNQKSSHPYGLGPIHDLEADIHFLVANYPKALSSAELAFNELQLEGREGDSWFVKAQIGLIYALMGNVDQAYSIGKEIDQKAQVNDLIGLALFNNITWCYLDRCRDFDYSKMKTEILDWSGAKNGRLRKLLSFVESVECR